jgi:hemerythrin-like domain-containing protein
MKATEVLMEEHEVILRVLTALEKALSNIPNGKFTPDFFMDAADFIKNFADGCHHAKEEGVLFVDMEASGIPVNGGPIGVMLADHEQGRQYTRLMREAAEKWRAGDTSAVEAVRINGLGYVNLLRQHIQKENTILFPMADRAVPTGKQSAVWERFEKIEREETGEGVHEKYEALAKKLEVEASEFLK